MREAHAPGTGQTLACQFVGRGKKPAKSTAFVGTVRAGWHPARAKRQRATRRFGSRGKIEPGDRVAYPGEIAGERTATPFALRRNSIPIREVADRAHRVVEIDARAIDAAIHRGLVDAARGVEHVVASDIEPQIAEVVVAIRPGSAIIVEHAVDRVGMWIKRDVVQADVTLNQDEISGV